MPVYQLQGPDGRVYQIEGPEGATAEQLAAFVQSQPKVAIPQQYDPTEGMSTFEKAMAGAGKAVADTGLGLRQVGARLFGSADDVKRLQQEVAETRARDAALMNTGAGLAGNVGGQIAMALLPGGALRGAGAAAQAVPGAARVAQALQAGGTAMMAPTSVSGAAALGAAQGALQPSVSGQETATNALTGGLAAGAVPAVVRGARIAKALMDPFSEAGQRQIVGRALNRAAGSADDAALALRNLREASTPFVGPVPENEVARGVMGEIVPGSLPTAGQAAGVPSLAALERTATATDPTVMNELTRRAAANNQARVAAIDAVAGAGGARDFAEANRRAVGNELYGAARTQGINPAAMTPEAQANIAAFQQRLPDDILQRARELAQISGTNMDNETSVQGLHWVKMAIDDRIGAAQRAGDNTLARAYTGLQNDLLNGLDELSPAYGEARRTYAAMSRPINEMDVAQSVADRSVNRLTGNVQPQAFARALSDNTAATVTGMPNATLEGVMQPRNLQALRNVQEDLARDVAAQNVGRGPGSDTIQKLAFSNLMSETGVPSLVAAPLRRVGVGGALERVGQVAYRDANQQMQQRLAEALMDPQATAALMEAGMVSPAMQRLVQGTSGSGLAMSPVTGATLIAPMAQALGLSYAPQQ